MKLFISAILILSIVLSGCSWMKPLNEQDVIITTLIAQRVAYDQFQNHPEWKESAIKIIDVTLEAIDSKVVMDLGSASRYIKNRVPMSRLLPTEREFVSRWIDGLFNGIHEDLERRGIKSPSQEMIRLRDVLLWVREMAVL